MISRDRSAGFTLLEFLSVVMLLGIVSVAAFSRLDIDPFRAASFEQELRSAIRFAQKFAIVSGCDVQVSVVDATDFYAINLRADAIADGCLDANDPLFSVPLNNPTGGSFSGNAPDGVDIGPDITFVYDRQGRPSASVNITVDTQTITIEAVTGYVH